MLYAWLITLDVETKFLIKKYIYIEEKMVDEYNWSFFSRVRTNVCNTTRDIAP